MLTDMPIGQTDGGDSLIKTPSSPVRPRFVGLTKSNYNVPAPCKVNPLFIDSLSSNVPTSSLQRSHMWLRLICHISSWWGDITVLTWVLRDSHQKWRRRLHFTLITSYSGFNSRKFYHWDPVEPEKMLALLVVLFVSPRAGRPLKRFPLFVLHPRKWWCRDG